METFYVTPEQFWNWFNREDDQSTFQDDRPLGNKSRGKNQRLPNEQLEDVSTGCKRQKTDTRPKNITDTEAATRTDSRYFILYGRHKPGKKNKVWEGDGYISLVGQMAHVCDLRGRLLEEPTVLDEVDYKLVEDLGELIIGNTEIQVVEPDRR